MNLAFARIEETRRRGVSLLTLVARFGHRVVK
jgi:hypothetical protein